MGGLIALGIACVPALVALAIATFSKKAPKGLRGIFILAAIGSIGYAAFSWWRVSAAEGGFTPFGGLALGVFATIVLFYIAVSCVVLLLLVSYARTGQSFGAGGLGAAVIFAALVWVSFRYGPILLRWGGG